jgi:hypothetical protein
VWFVLWWCNPGQKLNQQVWAQLNKNVGVFWGLQFSRIWERMFGKKEMRILMVGLDAAGKVNSDFMPSGLFC